jgi:hypothetical protein
MIIKRKILLKEKRQRNGRHQLRDGFPLGHPSSVRAPHQKTASLAKPKTISKRTSSASENVGVDMIKKTTLIPRKSNSTDSVNFLSRDQRDFRSV